MTVNRLGWDTETTDKWVFGAPATASVQPHIIQIAAVHFVGREEVDRLNVIVRLPDGVDSAPGALAAHGITRERSLAEGVPLAEALDHFFAMAEKVEMHFGHNITFDMDVLLSACHRAGMAERFELIKAMRKRDTMRETTNICRIPGPKGFKWPKLMEAYCHLVDAKGFDGAHDAFYDVMASSAVLFALEDLEEKDRKKLDAWGDRVRPR